MKFWRSTAVVARGKTDETTRRATEKHAHIRRRYGHRRRNVHLRPGVPRPHVGVTVDGRWYADVAITTPARLYESWSGMAVSSVLPWSSAGHDWSWSSTTEITLLLCFLFLDRVPSRGSSWYTHSRSS